MSTYSLAQRGVLSITSADTSPKDVTLASSIKPGSAQLHAVIRDRRQDCLVQRGSVAITDADTSPKDVAITAVDPECTRLHSTHQEDRAGDARGVTVVLLDEDTVRITWPGTLAPGETVDVTYEVVESRPRRGATVRILDANTVRVEWDGTLADGETIDVAWEVWDIAPLGDDIKEILFRLLRVLGYLGENCRQDLLQYDDAGNVVRYRLRIFDSREHAEASDLDLPEGSGLQDGELARAVVTQDIDAGKNDRIDLMQVLDTVIATPGVG